MTRKDAAMFPVIASGALFGLYIFFKLFSKEYINLLLTGYFFLLGVLAMAHILSPAFSRVLRSLLPSHFYRWEYRISFQRWSTTQTDECEEYFDYRFSYDDVACWIFCCLFGVWYLWKKHWVANNLFGLAFAVNGVELLHINTVATGCILLGGLFVYDIFWVFGTDVMVTVAKSFEAPIKRTLEVEFVAGFAESVLNRQRNLYFVSSFVAYVLGLALTIFIMVYFNHAQPALLYLVPACIGVPLTVAAIMGDITAMFKYEDHPADEKASGTDDQREREADGDSDQKTPKASPASAKKNSRKEK
ncbi:hypothetical protein HPB52_019836 [Rhipicephalus sanguineus]|uniref:Signal peptide peptidase n=1 Tax=Rhipicephalus sanguineus TaxID=34632 RepID=A0A9D4QE75_RHISA|nr:hypothetical protein HPB52_019836 [Rhipicephalus sanguineus]